MSQDTLKAQNKKIYRVLGDHLDYDYVEKKPELSVPSESDDKIHP